jgi:hypothetical protein
LAAAAFLAAGVAAASGPLPAASAAAVPAGLGGQNWTAIPTNAKVVALTFDAGANADGVSSILSTLARYHVSDPGYDAAGTGLTDGLVLRASNTGP